MIIRIILIVFFLILSAFFSGTEIVYAKVNKLRLEREANNGDKKSAKALKYANDFDRTITTVLIGNNLVNIALSSVATLVATALYLSYYPEATDLSTLGTVITTAVVTLVVLLFGEIIPKTVFPNFSYPLSRFLTPFVAFLSYLFYPIIILVNVIVNFLAKPFIKITDENEEEETIDDELNAMTEELEESGQIDSDDAELIKSAITFTDKVAIDIMIPRVDVIAYDIQDGFENIIKDEKFFENSRVPIYNESIDNIIGIIDTTKVLRNMLNHIEFDEKDVLYDALFVHKTMPLANILKELKKSHIHLAIVVDEWGGMMGILTMEDILEELFGDIWDETDVVEEEYEELSENEYLVNGDMNIHDFFDLVDYDDRDFESEYTTVGGWCTEILDKFPDVGDHFEFENLSVEIISTDGIRVEKIKVIITPIEEEE